MNELTAEAIWALEMQRRDAMLAADVPALEALLAPSVIYTHSNGKRDTKDDYLQKLRTGELRYHRLEFVEPRISIVERTAVVVARQDMTVARGGVARELSSLYLTVYARVDGQWVVVAMQATPLPQ